MVHADPFNSYCVALVVVAHHALEEWASKKGISNDDFAELCEKPEALKEVLSSLVKIDALTGGNRGYNAEVNVITYHHGGGGINDDSKFRILLMIPCLPEFWSAWEGAHYNRASFKDSVHLSEEQLLPDTNAVSLNTFLDKLVIKVVPMENLNDRKLVEEGDLCERRNGLYSWTRRPGVFWRGDYTSFGASKAHKYGLLLMQ